MNKPICLIAIFTGVLFQSVFGLEAIITLDPDTNLIVGQPLFLSAAASKVAEGEEIDTFAWDFGDGYALKNGYPKSYSAYTGISCTHPFMKPGTFPVQLYLVDKNKNRDTATINIHVSGEAPIPGFEVWHAPIHARIAQYFYIQIPQNIVSPASNKLVIKLTRKGYNDSTLFSDVITKPEIKFLFENGKLLKGEYSLIFEINNTESTISRIIELFSKDYDFIPAVGIDKNNSICINGKPFFPVTPFLLDKSKFKPWNDGKYVNCMYGIGYYPTQNAASWGDYLVSSWDYKWYVIGPTRWDWTLKKPFTRNSDIFKIDSYIEAAKGKNALLLWSLWDEPNMGGRSECIPVEVINSWNYYVQKKDNQHPTCINMYGYDYLPYFNDQGSFYDFVKNADFFGGKKTCPVDVIGFDVYPIQAATHATLLNRPVISNFITAFNKLQSSYEFLLPTMAYIEVQELGRFNTPAPNKEQILMEAWLSVIHGAKGINWFHYFNETPATSFEAMATFNAQIAKYSSIILSTPPEKKVVSSADTIGNRVDIMYRKLALSSDTTHYIFATRLTEPDSSDIYIQCNEPDSITATFDVSCFAKEGKIVIDGTAKELSIVDGKFNDLFTKCQTKIYRLGPDVSLKTEALPRPNKHIVRPAVSPKSIHHYNLKGQIQPGYNTIPKKTVGLYLTTINNSIVKINVVIR